MKRPNGQEVKGHGHSHTRPKIYLETAWGVILESPLGRLAFLVLCYATYKLCLKKRANFGKL